MERAARVRRRPGTLRERIPQGAGRRVVGRAGRGRALQGRTGFRPREAPEQVAAHSGVRGREGEQPAQALCDRGEGGVPNVGEGHRVARKAAPNLLQDAAEIAHELDEVGHLERLEFRRGNEAPGIGTSPGGEVRLLGQHLGELGHGRPLLGLLVRPEARPVQADERAAVPGEVAQPPAEPALAPDQVVDRVALTVGDAPHRGHVLGELVPLCAKLREPGLEQPRLLGPVHLEPVA